MRYYAPSPTSQAIRDATDEFCNEVENMLSPVPPVSGIEAVGTCTAWAVLLHRVLAVQGIPNSGPVEVLPSLAEFDIPGRLGVGAWEFAQHRTAGSNGRRETRIPPGSDDKPLCAIDEDGKANRPCITPGSDRALSLLEQGDDMRADGIHRGLEDTTAGRSFPYIAFDPANRNGGVFFGDVFVPTEFVAGQGNFSPPFLFGNHYIVEIGVQIYDPSYGLGPFSSTEEHEQSAFTTEGATKDLSVLIDGASVGFRDVLVLRPNLDAQQFRYQCSKIEPHTFPGRPPCMEEEP